LGGFSTLLCVSLLLCVFSFIRLSDGAFISRLRLNTALQPRRRRGEEGQDDASRQQKEEGAD